MNFKMARETVIMHTRSCREHHQSRFGDRVYAMLRENLNGQYSVTVKLTIRGMSGDTFT